MSIAAVLPTTCSAQNNKTSSLIKHSPMKNKLLIYNQNRLLVLDEPFFAHTLFNNLAGYIAQSCTSDYRIYASFANNLVVC